MNKQNQSKKGFTLVELIVVVTILAILGTIAIMAFSGYSKNARDSRRISDINNIVKNLELFKLEKGFYPNASNAFDVTYLGSEAWSQGTFGEETIMNVGRIDKVPKDPLTENEYTYAVTNTRSEYEIAVVYEGVGVSSMIGEMLVKQSYAADVSELKAMVKGTYNGKFVRVQTGSTLYLIGTPTIITTAITETDIETIIYGKQLVYEGYKNLPGSYQTMSQSGGFNFTPGTGSVVLFSGTEEELNTDAGKLELAAGIEEYYNGTLLINEIDYKEIGNIDTINSEEAAITLVEYYLNKKGGVSQAPQSQTQINNANCILGTETILHGNSITTYDRFTMGYSFLNNCGDYSQQRSCTNGILSGESTYQYTQCTEGEPNNCNAQIYTYNSHNYTLSTILHGQTATNIESEVISIENGIKKYMLLNIHCNDGELTTAEEDITPILTCNANFHTEDNATCISNTRSCSITNGTGQETWNGTSWGSCTVVGCNSGYVEQGNQCVNENCNGTTPTSGKISTATSTVGGTWNYNTTPGLCTYVCDTNYTWDSTNCNPNTQTYTCTSKPANTEWNTVGSYMQTWNGSTWLPIDSITSYNTIGDTASCRYQCTSSYHTEDSGNTCISDSRTNQSCTNLPTNAEYYSGTSSYAIPQNWNGTIWTPQLSALSAGYSAIPTQNTCEFKCNTGYTWNAGNGTCDINTYTVSGGFGANANGATINVCGSNVTADTSGNFTTTRNYGSVCNNITATRSGYSCVTTTNGPSSLTSNVTNIAGNCSTIWTATSTTGVPTARSYHAAVWTGTEMIVWGGNAGVALNTGGRYNPTTDSWTTITATGAPTARWYHSAVWTGTEMIVWGGNSDAGNTVNTGGRYNPTTNTWTAITTTGAPAARGMHTAVWTGTEMIVWGGSNSGGAQNTGGRYNPTTNTWTTITTTGAPTARQLHTAIWTGTEMIVWGGGNSYLNTGAKYNPSSDTWIPTTTTGAPSGRRAHSMIWTGTEMIVWGGTPNGSSGYNDGGRYNPSSDTWSTMSTTGAPLTRYYHTVIWIGTEMIVWGGITNSTTALNDGGRYNPSTNVWVNTNNTGTPSIRDLHTAIWTGTEMIIWGGFNPGNSTRTNTGGRYIENF